MSFARPASSGETAFYTSHEKSGLLIDSNILVVRGKPLSASRCIETFSILQIHEPILRSRIINENGKLLLTSMPETSIDFRVKEERDTEDWWVEELQNDIEEKFNSNLGPYWRATLFISSDDTEIKEKDNYLLFTFHHALFDGASIMAFYQKFLKVYAFLDEGGVFDDQQIGKIIPFTEPPPISSTDVCEKKAYWWTLLKTIARFVYYFYFTKRCTYNKSRWIREGYAKGVSEEAHTTLLPFKLEAEDLNALKVACKKRNVTVHAAIVAATQLAFKETYKTPGNHFIQFHVASYRKYCTPAVSQQVFGAFMAPFVTFNSIPQTNAFWGIARQTQKQVHDEDMPRHSTSNFNYFISKFSSKVYTPPEPAEDVIPDRSENLPMCISNRGLFSDIEYGGYRAVGTWYATAEHKSGAFYHCHNLCSFNNTLYWSLVYYTNACTKEYAQKFRDNILTQIREATKE